MMQTVAWLASGLVFTTFYMRDQVRMRQMAVLANVTFICYALLGLNEGIFDKVLPIFVLHVSTLGVNLSRLREASALTGRPLFDGAAIKKASLLFMAGILSVTTQAHMDSIIPEVIDNKIAAKPMSTATVVIPPISAPQPARWQWPLNGKVESVFRAAENKGIDIAAGSTNRVVVAASGIVVYSGNGPHGYGQLVIIQHPDSYQTAYGLNSNIRHHQIFRTINSLE